MNILLHTIALEPARWKPQKVAQPLAGLIPHIARTPFKQLEIFEPHLTLADDESALRDQLMENNLTPAVLSSYLELTEPNEEADDSLRARVARFGFEKVRLFPGRKVSPTDDAAIALVADRVRALASSMPEVELLLETHDGSIADDPQRLVDLLGEIDASNVGLLYQPTVFAAEPALAQLAIQRPHIRHVHLQNRHPDRSFAPLAEGVIPWRDILAQLDVDCSLEFVPSGIRPVEPFDLERVLAECVRDASAVNKA